MPHKTRQPWFRLALPALAALLLFTGCGPQQAAAQPQLTASFTVSIGAAPGEPTPARQRLSYEGTITNSGQTVVQGLHWSVPVAPELLKIAYLVTMNPGLGDPAPNLPPGASQRFSGSIDFVAEGLSKEQIAQLAGVSLHVTDGTGRELLSVGASNIGAAKP